MAKPAAQSSATSKVTAQPEEGVEDGEGEEVDEDLYGYSMLSEKGEDYGEWDAYEQEV